MVFPPTMVSLNSSETPGDKPSQPASRILNDVVIRLAGNSQDDIQAVGGFLARLAGRSAQEVMTYMTIPSTISGGPSIFQVRMGTGDILSAGDRADVLVAFYQHSYESHRAALRPGGVLLYDSDHVQPNPEDKEITAVGVPNPDLDADMAWELRDLPGIGLTFESRRLLRERRMPAMPTKPIVDRHWRERDLEGIGIRTGICGWDGGAELSRSSIPNLTARSDFRSDFGEMGVCCLSKYLMQKEWSG